MKTFSGNLPQTNVGNAFDLWAHSLAAVIKFVFNADRTLSWFSEPFHSPAFDDFDKCFFFGNGVTKANGLNICFENPAVNLLPIDGQLWLTSPSPVANHHSASH